MEPFEHIGRYWPMIRRYFRHRCHSYNRNNRSRSQFNNPYVPDNQLRSYDYLTTFFTNISLSFININNIFSQCYLRIDRYPFNDELSPAGGELGQSESSVSKRSLSILLSASQLQRIVIYMYMIHLATSP